jgi:ribonuclease HII
MELLHKWTDHYIEAGCDEVGRGCLSGPVVAAAVILDDKFKQNLVNDSKKLTFKTRMDLDSYIKDNVKNYAIAELPFHSLMSIIFLMQVFMPCIVL